MRGFSMLLCAAFIVAGCGGGGGSSAPATPPPATTTTGANVMPVTVDAGPADTVNVPFVSVTICSPGSAADCRTIDHVIVDTGSSGLRVLASALPAGLDLPQQTDDGGNPLVECMQFADGYSWGPVKSADVRLGGELISSLTIQIIGSPDFTAVPAGCSSTGIAENTVQAFGGNGILGVGLFRTDCGDACTQTPAPSGVYYGCSGGGCSPATVALTKQIANPVALLATDNNGVALTLPLIDAAGAETVGGSLVLGIGTQGNNALGSAKIFRTDATSGTLVTRFNGRDYTSFIDSGSNAFFFSDGLTPLCFGGAAKGFYCPLATQQLTASMMAYTGAVPVDFSVANANILLAANPGHAALNNLAGPTGVTLGLQTFDWGLSFFYGRTVFTALENAATPAGNGPFFAY